MTDIVKRLRHCEANPGFDEMTCRELGVAADEIERLRGLLREWVSTADMARDLTFAPIAHATMKYLTTGGAASQPDAAREGK